MTGKFWWTKESDFEQIIKLFILNSRFCGMLEYLGYIFKDIRIKLIFIKPVVNLQFVDWDDLCPIKKKYNMLNIALNSLLVLNIVNFLIKSQLK